MRIYISGPITNEPNYRRNFAVAQQILEEQGHKDIINPAELSKAIPSIEKMNHEEIILLCFDLLARCDAIVMLPGWRNSTGCTAEWGYALGCGTIIVAEFEDFVKRG